jgi:hypothetical protein
VRMVGAVVGGQIGAALLTSRTIAGTAIPHESAYTITFALSAVTALVAAGIAFLIASRPAQRQLEAVETRAA